MRCLCPIKIHLTGHKPNSGDKKSRYLPVQDISLLHPAM